MAQLKKVAIVAKGGTSSLAPWHDKSWEIWGMPWIKYPRVDLLFDMHENEVYRTALPHAEDYWKNEEWINSYDKPLYCTKDRQHLPYAMEYPMNEVIASIPFPYLENTISYMLALAIHNEVDEIGLWGVHMRGQYEYEAERPSITYLIGLAQGKGIKVSVVDGCPLFASVWEQGRYGVNNRARTMHPGYTARLK